ncbi:MAG: hypothetical protein ACTMUB_09370 [cyanobacterium endosymbiont of Rhopalodia musculus]
MGAGWYIISATPSTSDENRGTGYNSVAYIKLAKNNLVVETIDNINDRRSNLFAFLVTCDSSHYLVLRYKNLRASWVELVVQENHNLDLRSMAYSRTEKLVCHCRR